MAEALIDSLSDEQLDPGRYRDVHRETLTALIDAKATGRAGPQDAAAGRGITRPAERSASQHRGGQATPIDRKRWTAADRRACRHGQEEGQEACADRTRGPTPRRSAADGFQGSR